MQLVLVGCGRLGCSEGAGAAVLERLTDAVAQRPSGARSRSGQRGESGRGVQRADGAEAAQEPVIRAALASAGLGPGEVDAVEGHGTGTVLGDPIEARALLATYGQRGGGEPLWLGSVKSNIGHSSAAVGLAGVIKMLLAALAAPVARPLCMWMRRLRTRTGRRGGYGCWRMRVRGRGGIARGGQGVSAFGISGTNAHVIIQEAPLPRSAAGLPAAGRVLAASGVVGLVVSGHQKEAVRDQAGRVAVWWRDHPGTPAADVAVTLAGRGPGRRTGLW